MGEVGKDGHEAGMDRDQSFRCHTWEAKKQPKMHRVCLGQCEGREKRIVATVGVCREMELAYIYIAATDGVWRMGFQKFHTIEYTGYRGV